MTFRKPGDPASGYTITHPNGQTSFYHLDDFTDPWIPASEKQVILIQHGCARSSELWYHWIPRLACHYIVIRRDARGHGRSSFPKRLTPWSEQEQNLYEGGYVWDMSTVVGEIVDFIDQLGVRKVHFLGEATSGAVGEVLAATYPERVASLITCSSPTHLPPQAIELFRVGQPSWPEAIVKLTPRGWNEAMAKRPGTLPVTRAKGYYEWLLDETSKTPAEGLAGYVIFLTGIDSRPYLKDIKCPMLILAPTASAACPKTESEFVKDQVEQASLVWVESPGHEIFAERPEECIDAVLDFLEGLGNENKTG